MRTRFATFGIPLCLSALLIFAGCGDKEGGKDGSDSAKTEGVTVDENGPAGKFKAALMEMTDRMMEIAEDVESVEDAQKAEPEIGKAMDAMAAKVNAIAAGITTPSDKERKEFDNLAQDPDLKAQTDKVNARMEQFKKDHPEASAKLEEIARNKSQSMGMAMSALMQKMGPPMSGAQMPPPEMPDSAAPNTAAPKSDTAK